LNNTKSLPADKSYCGKAFLTRLPFGNTFDGGFIFYTRTKAGSPFNDIIKDDFKEIYTAAISYNKRGWIVWNLK